MHTPIYTDKRHLIFKNKHLQHCTAILYLLLPDIIQLMTFDEVNTRIDQFLYSPKLQVINCFII